MEMEDVEVTGREEKSESLDVDTKVATLGVKLREQLTNMQA